jgi:hypothetical protein
MLTKPKCTRCKDKGFIASTMAGFLSETCLCESGHRASMARVDELNNQTEHLARKVNPGAFDDRKAVAV